MTMFIRIALKSSKLRKTPFRLFISFLFIRRMCNCYLSALCLSISFKRCIFFLECPWYFKNQLFKIWFHMCAFMHLEACNAYSLITAPSPSSASLASMLLQKIMWEGMGYILALAMYLSYSQ